MDLIKFSRHGFNLYGLYINGELWLNDASVWRLLDLSFEHIHNILKKQGETKNVLMITSRIEEWDLDIIRASSVCWLMEYINFEKKDLITMWLEGIMYSNAEDCNENKCRG